MPNEPQPSPDRPNRGRPRYDLEARTETFAADVRAMIRGLSLTPANQEDSRQLVRSSGSVAANYIEANDSPGRKDFAMHIKIWKKEAKESRLWLRLLDAPSPSLAPVRDRRVQESTELMNIFGAILKKSE